MYTARVVTQRCALNNRTPRAIRMDPFWDTWIPNGHHCTYSCKRGNWAQRTINTMMGLPDKRVDPLNVPIRYKYDGKKSYRNGVEIELEDNEFVSLFDNLDGKDNKVTQIKLTSLRADLLIKSGLGMARNKVEAAFYESKIRVNGKKIPKKSVSIKTGDEIDVVKGFCPMNPDNIILSRIEVLSVKPNSEDITVGVRRFKSLTIENYEGANAWKSQSTTL